MADLLVFILKSLLLAGAALGLLQLLKRRSAALRSAIAHAALMALLIAPLAGLALPPLRIVHPVPIAAVAAIPEFSDMSAISAAAGGLVGREAAVRPKASAPFDWLLPAYGLPLIILLLITLMAVWRLFRLRGRADRVDDPVWLAALDDARRRIGVSRPVALLVGEELCSPISLGLLRPAILLDRVSLESSDRAGIILAHELAHIARFDWALLMLGRLAAALYWCNPLVWMLTREAHQLREEAADDAALGQARDVRNADYAELLIHAARHQYYRGLSVAHGMAPGRRSLARRIQRVLDTGAARAPVAHGVTALAMLGALGLATPLAALSIEAHAHSVPSPSLPTRVMQAVAADTPGSVRSVMTAPPATAVPQQAPAADMVAAAVPAALSDAPAPLVIPTVAVTSEPQPAPSLAPQRAPAPAPALAPYLQRSTFGAAAYLDKDYIEAAKQWSAGAEEGDMASSYFLAGLYARGEGVKRDREKAIAVYRQVALSGNATPVAGSTISRLAMARLVRIHDVGLDGYGKDLTQRTIWLERWAATGDPVGVQTLARFEAAAPVSNPNGAGGCGGAGYFSPGSGEDPTATRNLDYQSRADINAMCAWHARMEREQPRGSSATAGRSSGSGVSLP